MQYNLSLGTKLIRFLSEFVQKTRSEFDEIEEDANILTKNLEYKETMYA